MRFTESKLRGSFLIDMAPIEDQRGFFARSFCRREFEQQGLNPHVAQCSVSFNKLKGTLRGMHYQMPPCAEVKVVRCTMGSIYDVIIDLRPDSPTFKQWTGVELNARNHKALYIPEGFAHGFLTLADESEVHYQMSEFFAPEYSAGVRWNDPSFSVQWPGEVKVIADRDLNYPDFAG